MPNFLKPRIIYLGFNDPRKHVRGTENVIRMQSESLEGRNYYVFRSSTIEVFRWGHLIAIGCPRNLVLATFFLRCLVRRVQKRTGVQPFLHAHSYLLAMIANGAPLIFTVHDGLTYLKRSFGCLTLWPFRLIERWVYHRSIRIHAISRYAWSQICGGRHVSRKVSVIYNSLPTKSLGAGEEDINHIPRSQIEYLVVRSIEPRANLDLIVDLARVCLREEPAVSILIAGKGPQLAHYREIQEREGLNNLRFLGYVSDGVLDALYRRADCVIMPALYGEGFGLPLIEAYARGTPAVGSNVCAVPEVIQNMELMFENNLPSLRRAINHARALPRSAFREHFEIRFSQERVREQYRGLYESLD